MIFDNGVQQGRCLTSYRFIIARIRACESGLKKVLIHRAVTPTARRQRVEMRGERVGQCNSVMPHLAFCEPLQGFTMIRYRLFEYAFRY